MKQKISQIFLYYLRFFARLQLNKMKLLNPKLITIGITGSAGKTSTLLATEAALKPYFRVKTNTVATLNLVSPSIYSALIILILPLFLG